MREMTAVQEVESHHGIAEIEKRLIHCIVGGCAGKRLNVDIDLISGVTVGRKGFRRAPTCQRLDHIGIFHAFVIARVATATIMS